MSIQFSCSIQVCGGPQLIQLIDFIDSIENLSESAFKDFLPEIYDLAPLERREIKIRIFGIDPSATAAAFSQNNVQNSRLRGNSSLGHVPSGNSKEISPTPVTTLGEEHKVYVRRHTSASLNQSNGNYFLFLHLKYLELVDPKVSRLKSTASLQIEEATKNKKYSSSRSNSEIFASENESLLHETGFGKHRKNSIEQHLTDHDLIPYTGKYERLAKLPLAITIVPAVNVSDWHILSGDSPLTRYVVVDVANRTDMDAELTYSNGRMLWVQPKEVCRVPLLCPCCADIQSSAFAAAAQQASHMMQMREIERLRRSLERHVSKHLDIRWSIPTLKLDGFVPVGSLLSSVSFLKQLVIPAISVCIKVNNAPYVSEDDVSVGIGELITIQLFTGKSPINGEIVLHCFQDLHNGEPSIDRSENMVLCGPCRIPFSIQPNNLKAQKTSQTNTPTLEIKPQTEMSHFETEFSLLFRYEGVHKIRPEILNLQPVAGEAILNEDDIFLPTVSFNVITKV